MGIQSNYKTQEDFSKLFKGKVNDLQEFLSFIKKVGDSY